MDDQLHVAAEDMEKRHRFHFTISFPSLYTSTWRGLWSPFQVTKM